MASDVSKKEVRMPRAGELPQRQRRELEFFSAALVRNKYRLEKIIGRGGYGVVARAINTETGERVAVKRVQGIMQSRATALRALRELKFLRLLRKHQNIIRVKDVLVPARMDTFDDIYLVFELMPADLERLLRSKTILSKDHVKFLLLQLLCAVHFMHTANVFHRDLNPKNILVDEDCRLRVCDFGLARASFQKEDNHLWTDYVATRWYRAPELILTYSNKYSTALDIWSVGCIFAEMLSGGRPLFPGTDARNQFDLITRVTGRPSDDLIERIDHPAARRYLQNFPIRQRVPLSRIFSHESPAAIQLLEGFLEFDADKRLTAIDALASPYFSEFRPIDIGMQTGPLDESDFAFERTRLTSQQMRYEFLREITHYHPEMITQVFSPLRPGDYSRNVGMPTAIPSSAESFALNMSNVERNVPKKDCSLPEKYYMDVNPQEAIKADPEDFKSITFGEAELNDVNK